jgi:hypothetical protein
MVEINHVQLCRREGKVSPSHSQECSVAECRACAEAQEAVFIEPMPARTNKPYKSGELDVILSLAPTTDNIRRLSLLLDRSEGAIEIVYKIAFEHGPFAHSATVQMRKILEAKNRVGIKIGRRQLPSQ